LVSEKVEYRESNQDPVDTDSGDGLTLSFAFGGVEKRDDSEDESRNYEQATHASKHQLSEVIVAHGLMAKEIDYNAEAGRNKTEQSRLTRKRTG
jgi:hypothetical protein